MLNNTINLNAIIKFSELEGGNDLMWNLSVQRGEIVECMTPDGPSDDFVCTIWLNNFYTGSQYVFKTPIYGRTKSEDYEDKESGYCETVTYYQNAFNRASDLVEAMKAKGTLDLTHWMTPKQED